MKQHKVLFLPHNKEITVVDGENLIRAAMTAGIHINASCGGAGVCGKCRIFIEKGNVDGGITEKLSKEDYTAGYRQACLSFITSDVIVRVPQETAIDAHVLNASSSPSRAAHVSEMNFEVFKEDGRFSPPVEKKYLNLPKPTAKDNIPDVARLISYLKRKYNERGFVVELPVIRKIPDIFRKDNFNITATLARPVKSRSKTNIINIQAGDLSGQNYAIALDIGTTTIYGQLIDVNTGSVIAAYGDFNRQISYGEDVITRLVYAEKPEGLKRLHDVVVKVINHIIQKMVEESAIDPEQIAVIIIAGNTTMTQLMLTVTPKYIRHSPYVPASGLYPPINAGALNLAVGDHVRALIFPSISSYVGGDIVAGVVASGMHNAAELTLYMDIGTNAEVVIGNKDWLVCAACSAGPAFEGGGITFGMRATEGAIEDFSIDPLTLEPMNITVGDVRPRGICGSGLINIVAALFETGVIDNIGKFNRSLGTGRIRKQNGIYEYVLAWADESGIGRDIVLTEPDIDNLIRAKGALYSGCTTLLEEVGIGFQDIDRFVLAGGFGSYINLEKAMTIGLLPEIDPEKFTYLGNGSLLGATICCLANHIRKEVVDITRRMTSFELSETGSYMNNYMAALFLPHTDMSRFPTIKQRLEARK